MEYLGPFAEEYHVALVVPKGYGRSWNARYCCGEAKELQLDDVGFLAGIKKSVRARERSCVP